MRLFWLLLSVVLPLRPLADVAGPDAGTGSQYVTPGQPAEVLFLAPPPASVWVAPKAGSPLLAGRGHPAWALAAPPAAARPGALEPPPGTFVPLCERLPFHANAPPSNPLTSRCARVSGGLHHSLRGESPREFWEQFQ